MTFRATDYSSGFQRWLFRIVQSFLQEQWTSVYLYSLCKYIHTSKCANLRVKFHSFLKLEFERWRPFTLSLRTLFEPLLNFVFNWFRPFRNTCLAAPQYCTAHQLRTAVVCSKWLCVRCVHLLYRPTSAATSTSQYWATAGLWLVLIVCPSQPASYRFDYENTVWHSELHLFSVSLNTASRCCAVLQRYVLLPLCPSHAGIVSKWTNVRWCRLHWREAQCIYFWQYKVHQHIRKGSSRT